MATFYSLSGKRLQLPAITVAAASYLDVDLHQLLAFAGDEFREGSVNIAYQGINQQLGAQVKMVDAERNLIWAEQFVYGSKFISNRLETVWWLPFDETKTRVVVSNTSSETVSATIAIEGTAPLQKSPANITLAPWETRVLDIMTDLVGNGHGVVKSKGGISIVHTGSPGAVLARMFITDPNRGYSAAAIFIDPEMTASQRWHGSGLRLKNLDGTYVEPVLAVRNIGDQLSRVQGRIIYTQPDGSTVTVSLPQWPIAPGAIRVINLGTRVESANLPNAVKYGGIELEYDTPKGTIIASVQSVSRNGDHVFQVPMFDPQNMPSSAGGFPWKADGDYRTIVYIKNETDVARKFVSHLIYEGGQYSLGIQELGPGETVGIDFRELRDNQSPGSQRNVIPLAVDRGQIAWSVLGSEDKVLSGRSEQISLSGGVASTYACANCCPNVIDGVYVNPISLITEVSSVTQFTATQTEQNCYFQQFGPYQAYPDQWNSFNYNVATVDFAGNSEGVGVGDTNIQGCVERTIWYNWGGGYCEPFTDLMCDAAPVEVQPKITGPTNVWWFNGQTPSGYATSITLTASPTASGTYNWSVVSGADKVTLSNFTANEVRVTGVNASTFHEVGIRASINGLTSQTFRLSVRAPYRLVLTRNFEHSNNSTFGYSTRIYYRIEDQFTDLLPSDVPINEHWTTGLIIEYPMTNWTRGPAGAAIVSPAEWLDLIDGQSAGATPTAINPCLPFLCTTKVHHWNGEWFVGSSTIGVGRRVQTNTWQKFTDHAEHTNRVSPAP